METIINAWISACDLPTSANSSSQKVYRRCLVIKFQSDFLTGEEPVNTWNTVKPIRVGHCITLGLELTGQVMTLKIYDYRMHEYIHNVHDQMFQLMINAAQEYASSKNISIRTEVVCLKGKLYVDKEFMTCMSAAFRVCLFLSKPDGIIHESSQDFMEDSENLQGHTCKMMEWIQSDPGIQNHQYTPLLPPPMTQTVCEICPRNCYLVLAPYVPPGGMPHYNPRTDSDEKIATKMDKISPHVCYSLARQTMVPVAL